MKCTKKGDRGNNQIWTGYCRRCNAEFEAEKQELTIDSCTREGYEFAHADCPECKAKSGNAVIFYPKK